MKTVHLFGRMNQDDADKDLRNDEIRYAKNLMPAKRSNGLRRELVRGNVKLPGSEDFFQDLEDSSTDFDLSNLEVIGSFASTDADVIYAFYKNPNYIVKISIDGSGNYQYDYVPYQNRLIWNFANVGYIYNVSVINNKLHWCQENGEQYIINIDKDYTNALNINDNFSENIGHTRKLLYLQKLPPVFPLEVEGINTGADSTLKSREYLEDKSLKFTYRYIYETDDNSTFAPWSSAQPAFRVKKSTINNSLSQEEYDKAIAEYNLNPRYYELRIDKRNIQANVKAIEFAAIDEEDSVFIFKNIDRQANWNQSGNLIVEYTGSELEQPVSVAEGLKIQQPNPFNPNTSVAFNDRIFQCGGEVGLPYNGNSSVSATYNLVGDPVDLVGGFISIDFLIPTYSENGLTKLWARKPLFKPGGIYKVGVQFYDKNFKRSFVHGTKNIKIPVELDFKSSHRYELTLQTSGEVPSWAKYYQFVRSDITNLVTYTTTTGVLLHYVSENAEGAIPDDNQFVWQDRVYVSDSNPSKDIYSFTHVLLPQNIPFEIDNTYKIRFLNDDLAGQEYSIIEIIGNIAVIEQVDKSNSNNVNYEIELFKENYDQVEVMNEVGNVYDISDWGTSHEIEGDTYLTYSKYVNGAKLIFDNFNPTEGEGVYTAVLKAEIGDAEGDYVTTSQTTTLRQNIGSGTRIQTEGGIQATGEALTGGFEIFGIKFNQTFDPNSLLQIKNKIVQKYANMIVNFDLTISSKGRPNVVYKSEKTVTLDSTIYFSDPNVQGSKVNGLSNFQSNNSYNLPSERGPVVTLVPIDSSNVMLALHPRKTTSLYIGEGFIRQGNDSILAKTEGVIGDDKALRGDYGTTNPESVTVYNGTAIWWDQNKKEMMRYDNNGLTPLGLVYKMRTYFDEWGSAIQNRNVNILSGYDPYYESFFIKFPTIGDKQSETIYFSNIAGREGFIGVVSHKGESFTILQNELISLYEDKIFKSNNTTDFYGEERPEVSIEFVHNQEPMLSKIYESIAQNSDLPLYTEISNERGQETNMITGDFRQYEDTYYSEVLRDTNTFVEPSAPPIIKLRDGDLIKGQSATIKLSSSEATKLNEVVIESVPATGQYT